VPTFSSICLLLMVIGKGSLGAHREEGTQLLLRKAISEFIIAKV
jgi:hypothetical protein